MLVKLCFGDKSFNEKSSHVVSLGAPHCQNSAAVIYSNAIFYPREGVVSKLGLPLKRELQTGVNRV